MQITCNNDATRSLSLPWMDDDPVVFSSTGTAAVSAEVGERLADEIDAIEITEDTTNE
jgi:hypothetical protein